MDFQTIDEGNVSRFWAALSCLYLVLGLFDVAAGEADNHRKAMAAVSQLGQSTPMLSKRIEPLSNYSPTRATIQQHQALIAQLDALLSRAQTMLARKEVDPRTVRELERQFQSVHSQFRQLRGDLRDGVIDLLKDVDMMSTRARNEGDKIKGFFQGWQEKANQVDQQLTSILRILKDLGRVGVGGSDLGAS